MLELQEAKALKKGDVLYSGFTGDRKGNPHRVRVTSVKTWKTRPGKVEVRWVFGLREYGTISETYLGNWSQDFEEAKRVLNS